MKTQYLEEYITIRHQMEMWGASEQCELLDALVWKMLGLPGKPTDENSKQVLTIACLEHNIPLYKDIRD